MVKIQVFSRHTLSGEAPASGPPAEVGLEVAGRSNRFRESGGPSVSTVAGRAIGDVGYLGPAPPGQLGTGANGLIV